MSVKLIDFEVMVNRMTKKEYIKQSIYLTNPNQKNKNILLLNDFSFTCKHFQDILPNVQKHHNINNGKE